MTEETLLHNCKSCSYEIAENARYCTNCGTRVTKPGTGNLTEKKRVIWLTGSFFLVQLLLCSMIHFSDSVNTFGEIVLFDAMLIILTIAFIIPSWEHVHSALTFRGFSMARAGFYMLIAGGLSIMVQYIMTWLNHNLFDTEVYYFHAFSQTDFPLLGMFLTLAVNPAIFEELGFRGIIQGSLSKVIGETQAMPVTAFAFAIIHLSLLSIVWLIPFALLLGYIRMRENTIWYGVLMHFVFNAIAVLHDLPEYYPI